jgi:hypothetical protein
MHQDFWQRLDKARIPGIETGLDKGWKRAARQLFRRWPGSPGSLKMWGKIINNNDLRIFRYSPTTSAARHR